MHDLGVRRPGGHGQVDRDGSQRRHVRLRALERLPGLVPDHLGPAVAGAGLAPLVDRDVLQSRQLAAEVLDMYAGAAVDVRRVLAGE
jgi:hypothetical protein